MKHVCVVKLLQLALFLFKLHDVTDSRKELMSTSNPSLTVNTQPCSITVLEYLGFHRKKFI